MAKKKRSSRNAQSARSRTRKKTDKDRAGPPVVQLPIERHVSPDQKAVLANHVVVRNDGTSIFQIYFFDMQAPVIVEDDPDVLREKLKEIKQVDAHCVSRVAIPGHLMPSLIEALKTNLRRQQAIAATKQDGPRQTEDGDTK